MYAVIRTGGKQYRVAPGDVIRVEKLAPAHDDRIQFSEVLAVSSAEGRVSRPSGAAHVIGQVLGDGRGDKILVFHYKRKKQYKKLQGHRQPFTAVQITEISVDGETYKAPENVLKPRRVEKPSQEEAVEAAPQASKKAGKKAAPKKAAKKAAKKSSAKKSTGKKK
ncbi:MAG TPA: 50S ribosomal protein L21 [Terriglobales bacterium]|nr:50S ribosomal protein L21 [Terriglobales bacterium]